MASITSADEAFFAACDEGPSPRAQTGGSITVKTDGCHVDVSYLIQESSAFRRIRSG